MQNFDKVMRSVLQGAKYDVLTGRKLSLEEKITQLVYRVLDFIFEHLNINFNSSNLNINAGLIQNLFILAAVLVLLVAGGFLGAYLVRRSRRKTMVKDIFDEFRNNTMTLEELLAYGDQCGRDGNYAAALRYEYIAMITCFSDNNIVYITESMTGNQFRRAIRYAAPQFSAGVDSTVNLFYRLWFGKKAIAQEIFGEHQEMYHAMMKEAQHFEQKN